MHRTSIRWLLSAACGFFIASTQAQTPTSVPLRPDPLDAGVSVPALTYQSAIGQHRHFGNQSALSWREANQRVHRIGGWRAYAREAYEASTEQAPATRAPSATPGLPAGPAGQGVHNHQGHP